MSEKKTSLLEKMGELEYRKFRRDIAKLTVMHNRLKVKAEVNQIEHERDVARHKADSS